MPRLLLTSSIDELEALFKQSANNVAQLRQLQGELEHRTTKRAKILSEQVRKQLDVARTKLPVNNLPAQIPIPFPAPEKPLSPPPASKAQVSETPKVCCKHNASTEPQAFPPITNRPENILSAWTALEVLTPQSFNRPEDLASGDKTKVARFNEASLPWESGAKSRPNFRLYYQIVLGSLKLDSAISCLIERYGDSRPEKPSMRGRAALAVLVVNQRGQLVESPAVGVSSFAWGVIQALNSDLSGLAKWSDVESQLTEKIESILLGGEVGSDAQDKARQVPLSHKELLSAYEMLVKILGLPSEWVEAPNFAIRSYAYFKDSNPPEPLLLNSFFLDDLALAKQVLTAGQSKNLQQYLGITYPKTRFDLLQDKGALSNAVKPPLTPLARWPSHGNHPLVLLQQAAVNLAFQETRDGGLLGINGPPGTGKTTLLRDLVAGVVTQRAEVMASFDNPADAFEHTGQKIKVGNGWIHLYRLAESLRGFELLVASSNNKAVENVSAELPGLNAIADEASGLRYFKVLSDKLHQSETWGAIAAVLGNAKNRSQFKQDFWWDDDYGFNSYLQAVSGTVPQIEVVDPQTGKTTFRPPYIVETEKPPISAEDAMQRWKSARSRFLTALEKSRQIQRWLEGLHQEMLQLATYARNETDALAKRDQLTGEIYRCETELSTVRNYQSEASLQHQHTIQVLTSHRLVRPSFWARLFRTKSAKAWMEKQVSMHIMCREAEASRAEWDKKLQHLEGQFQRLIIEKKDAEMVWQSAWHRHKQAKQSIADAQQKYGVIFTDAEFFALQRDQYQQMTPWYPAAAQRLRNDVFITAMNLHRAFIDVAAKPLRHNLSALMNVFTNQTLPDAAKQALLSHLWSSLFLVVPLVSTTFASVNRMLGKLPFNSLGWLLVDEAGQALPQAAVGAMLRTKRAVIVGDPIQIEPVVMLPQTLTGAICRRFGVDPDQYAAPIASVQTLADAASCYIAEIEGKVGNRSVGVPLLVHRRCAEPMFGISNAVGYSGLMVFARQLKDSAIRKAIGSSRWIHVESGSTEDKWSEEEGNVVLHLLAQMAQAGVKPDVYIVTPFVIVADRLRQKIRENKSLQKWIADDIWKWTSERIGTVHTVQGRESEAVIFVLGAPLDSQTGARGWASARPNLLNVAVTRAKEVLYVVGNRNLWCQAGLFRELDCRLPVSSSPQVASFA